MKLHEKEYVMFKRLLTSSMVLGVIATATPALAVNCGPREDVIYRLQDQYSEQMTAGGLQMGLAEISVVEIWASDQTGTFTVLMTRANGVSCIVAAGVDYNNVAPVTQPKGTAS